MADCEHDLVVIDESFDHEFGTEVIQYLQCTICGDTAEEDESIPSPEDYYDN